MKTILYYIADSNYALQCPDDMVFYGGYWSPDADITWTLPALNNDSSGIPWNVTGQSLKPGRYDLGKHINVVYAVNSVGENSACTFILEVKRKYMNRFERKFDQD